MKTEITVKELLTKAIEKEISARQLYLNLSQKLTDQGAKDALKDLANQELGHRRLLERYLQGKLKGGASGDGQVLDYKIAEHLDQPEISLDMNLPDIFLIAANREMVAHEFYLGLAQFHPEGEVKRLFEKLATEELKHKHRVELLYTEVAFPQTDGG